MYRPPLLSRVVPRFLLLCVLPTAALTALLFYLAPGSEERELVQNAEWLTLPSGPALLLARSRDADPEDGGYIYDYGWRVLDARSGKELQATWYAESVRAGLRREVVTASGETVAYETEDGLHLRNLASGEDAGGAGLSRRLPGVALPVYQVRAVRGGGVALEADDKRRWLLELANGALDPLEQRPGGNPGSPHEQRKQWAQRLLDASSVDDRHCVARVWSPPLSSPRLWTFGEAKTERHSDTRTYALGQTQGEDGYGKLQGFEPLSLRVEYASFLCDERTGRVGEFPGGGALVMQWLAPDNRVALSRLGPDGTLAWTWPSPVLHHANCELEAFGHEGGFIVRIDATVVSLDAQGQVRWQAPR